MRSKRVSLVMATGAGTLVGQGMNESGFWVYTAMAGLLARRTAEIARSQIQRHGHNPVIRGRHRPWEYDLNAALLAKRSAAVWR